MRLVDARTLSKAAGCTVGFVAVLIIARMLWLMQTNGIAFESDLIALLPEVANSPLVEEIDRRASAEVKSNVIFIIQGTDAQQVDFATDQLLEQLQEEIDRGEILADLIDGPDFDEISERINAMLAYKDRLIGDNSRQRMQASVDAQLQSRIDQVIQFPPSNFTDPVLDPLGTLEEFIDERLPRPQKIQSDGLYFRVDNALPANMLLIKLHADELGGDETEGAIRRVSAIQKTIAREHQVNVFSAGIPLHAAKIKRATVMEISWMGASALILTMALFVFITRSLWALLVTVLAAGLAFCGGIVFSQGTIGLPHLIGLTMTTAVVGICVDFSFHFWIHVRSGKRGPDAVKAIRPAVNMGVVTTSIGLMAIVLIAVPVLAKTAMFIIGALLLSWLLVLFVFPHLAGPGGKRPIKKYAWRAIMPQKIALPFVLAIAVFSALGFVLKYHTDDRPIRLGRTFPDLIENDRMVNKLLGQRGDPTFYLVQSQSESKLLRDEEVLLASLSMNELRQVRAVSRMVVSDSRQSENRELFEHAKQNLNAEIVAEYLSVLGVPELNWQSRLDRYSLRWVVRQPWASLERNHVLSCNDNSCASMMHATGSAAEKLDVACQRLAECRRISFSERQTESFYRLRMELLWSLLFAAAAMFAVMYHRYRNAAFRLCLVPLLASFSGVAAVLWAGLPVTAFTLAAMFPLLGLSVDYAIFSHESGGNSWQTSFAIFASALTTIISFAILAFSGTMAIKFFALPVAVGIAAAWVTTHIVRQAHN